MGVPSGLRPMSASWMNWRAKALLIACVVWHAASTKAGIHVEVFIFAPLLIPQSQKK
jgi:hypothetical protein